ncbi:Chromo domain-containing protein [Entamoeba marina]
MHLKKLHKGAPCKLPDTPKYHILFLKFLELLFKKGTKGPYLIITDIEHIDFYKDNIRRYIPNALVTYITENSSDNSIYDILLKELYVEDTTLIRSSFVIMTDQSFRFKNKTHFDFMIIDVPTELKVSLSFKINTFVVFGNNPDIPRLLKQISKPKQTQHITPVKDEEQNPPSLKYVDVFLMMTKKQKEVYNKITSLMKTNLNQNDLIIEEMKRALTFPIVCSMGSEMRGCKYTFVIHLINILLKHTHLKIAVFGDYDKLLRNVASKTSANFIDWEIDIIRNKIVSNILSCTSSTEVKKIIDSYKQTINDLKTKEQSKMNIIEEKKKSLSSIPAPDIQHIFEPQPNCRIVCIDNNCVGTNLNFSSIDVVINLSNEYTPLFESTLKTKYCISTEKSCYVFELSICETIDEVTSAMNELDDVLTQDQVNAIYTDTVLNNTFKFDLLDNHKKEKLQLVLSINKTKHQTNSKQITVYDDINKSGFIDPKSIPSTIKQRTISLSNAVPDKKKTTEPKTPTKESIEKVVKITNKERIENMLNNEMRIGLDGKQYKKSKLKETEEAKSKVETPYERRMKKLNEITDVPIEKTIVMEESESVTSQEEITETEFHRLLKKKSPLSSIEKIHNWVQTCESALIRFGNDVNNWGEIVDQFIPLTKQQLQIIINEYLNSVEVSDTIKIAVLNNRIMRIAISKILSRTGLLPFPKPKFSIWDNSCDITLLLAIEKYGMNVPKLYLNDPILRGVLSMSGCREEQEKIQFLNERVTILIEAYKTGIDMKE